jgi:uncharacterized protein YegL
MRRLPVFFLLDVSESMIGDNLKKMEDGLSQIVRSLRRDPHALETVYLSVIAFAGKADTVAPLVDVASFYPPKLPVGGGTALGAALTHLMREIDHAVVPNSPERKGDWKPIVYLFTDGKPTDSVDIPITRWKRDYERKAHIIAIALGRYADLSALKQLTDTVLVFEDAKTGNFTDFIQWVTASLSAQSRSVGDNASGGVQLAKIDETLLRILKDVPPPTPHLADKDCVTLVGRCQKTRRPYLIKYDRANLNISTQYFKMESDAFELAGCFPLDEDYFAWSDEGGADLKVNTGELIGTPGCPHCGNPTAFAMCGCGGLLCIAGPGVVACPWCEKQVNFEPGGGGEGFDVRRSKG